MPALTEPRHGFRSMSARVFGGLKPKKSPKMHGYFDLRQLPQELIFHVLGYMSTGELARMSETSKKMRSLCTPLLYRDVDLRRHLPSDRVSEYLGGWDVYDMLSTVNQPGFHLSRIKDMRFRERQEAFLLNILAEPELARFVKNFEWTIQHFNIKSLLARQTEKLKILEFFSRARFVHLDIDQVIDEPRRYGLDNRFRTHRGLPENLFPKARIFRMVDPGNSWVAATSLMAVLAAKMQDFVIPDLRVDKIPGQHLYQGRAWTARLVRVTLKRTESSVYRSNNMREMYEAIHTRGLSALHDVYQRLAWPMTEVVLELQRRGLHIPASETRYMCVELDMMMSERIQLRCLELSVPDW